jgi:hypothetical protein
MVEIRNVKTTRKGNLSAAALLILAAAVLSLAAQQINSLIIVGQSGSAQVIQRDGHNYVDVEGLASLTQSSISFKGNQIVMALPGANTDLPTSVAPPAGFSKDFVTAGIEAMAQIREWRAALKNAIERNYPLTDTWLAPLRAQAQQALRLASIAVSTTSDKNVLPLLTNEFNNMSTLAGNYLQMSAAMIYIDPSSLDSNPLNQKITSCGRSLASMVTANQFIDDGSCR